MSVWTEFTINKKYVGMRTAKAVLINMPKESIYEGYSAWLSTKIVREHGPNQYTIAMRPGFDVILRMIVKNNDGNYVTGATKQITGLEFARQFMDEEDQI